MLKISKTNIRAVFLIAFALNSIICYEALNSNSTDGYLDEIFSKFSNGSDSINAQGTLENHLKSL